MGSFNIAGTMSNISIRAGTKVVFIPLLPTRYKYSRESSIDFSPKTMIVSNDGAAAYYSPRFLPIVGEYNDYGTLENIERDNNVEYIEQYFEMPIDDFMSIVTCSMDLDFRERKKLSEEKIKELQSLAGMFEVYDVYKKMIDYSIKSDDAFQSAEMNVYVFESLGFKETEKETGDKRYTKQFIHPDIPELEIHSDGRFCRSSFSGEEFGCYKPDYLDERLKKEGITLPQLEKFKGVSSYEFVFDKERGNEKDDSNEVEELLKEVEKDLLENNKLSSEELEEKMDKVRKAFSSQIEMKKNTLFNSGILPFYKMDYVIEKGLKKQYVELMEFSKIMFCTNNFFFPAMNGEQDGNLEATETLANVVLDYVKDNKWEDEDY